MSFSSKPLLMQKKRYQTQHEKGSSVRLLKNQFFEQVKALEDKGAEAENC